MQNFKSFSAIVFDMDGVVIDTRKPIEAFWHTIAGEHGVVITADIMERQIHGCPARQTVYSLFPHLSNAAKEELFGRCEHFETHMEYVAMSGVKKLLSTLNEHSIPVALVTSSLPPKVANVIKQLRLDGIFNTIVTADLVEKGKPDPACYKLAARNLSVNAESCLVFEDAVSGVKASTGAGMFTIGVGGSYQQPMLRQAGASEVIVNFEHVQIIPEQKGIRLQVSADLTLPVYTK